LEHSVTSRPHTWRGQLHVARQPDVARHVRRGQLKEAARTLLRVERELGRGLRSWARVRIRDMDRVRARARVRIRGCVD